MPVASAEGTVWKNRQPGPRGDSKVRAERESCGGLANGHEAGVPGPLHGVQSPLGLGDSGGVLGPGFLPLMEESPR